MLLLAAASPQSRLPSVTSLLASRPLRFRCKVDCTLLLSRHIHQTHPYTNPLNPTTPGLLHITHMHRVSPSSSHLSSVGLLFHHLPVPQFPVHHLHEHKTGVGTMPLQSKQSGAHPARSMSASRDLLFRHSRTRRSRHLHRALHSRAMDKMPLCLRPHGLLACRTDLHLRHRRVAYRKQDLSLPRVSRLHNHLHTLVGHSIPRPCWGQFHSDRHPDRT